MIFAQNFRLLEHPVILSLINSLFHKWKLKLAFIFAGKPSIKKINNEIKTIFFGIKCDACDVERSRRCTYDVD